MYSSGCYNAGLRVCLSSLAPDVLGSSVLGMGLWSEQTCEWDTRIIPYHTVYTVYTISYSKIQSMSELWVM